MKTKRYIAILIGLMMFSTSCSLLDVEPAMSLSEEGAVATKQDVLNALNGCYDGLQRAGYYGLDMVVIGDLPSNNLDATGTISEYRAIDLFTHRSDNVIILSMWEAIYDAINRGNNLLYRVDDVEDMTDEEIVSVKAELQFLRALHYFNLVRLFGDVPYREIPTLNADEALHIARTDKNVIYGNIIEDLEFAIDFLPDNPNHKANPWAAKALLSKVYLTLQQFEQAFVYADDVITNGPFSLSNVYEDLFSQDNNNEIIFRIDFSEQDRTRIAQYFAPTALSGRKEFWPTDELVNLFTANDTRKASTIAPEGHGYKYRDITTGTDNVIVFRLADMILTRAEALANADSFDENIVRNDINAIRNRALVGNYSGSNHLEEVQLQRRLEFAFEGHRWFDLVRTGTATAVLGISEHHTLFPIPQAEITNNDKINESDQNPGY